MSRTAFVLVLVLVLPAMVAAQERRDAFELGLTPNHVYSLWSNINGALLVVARIQAKDATWDRELSSMAVRAPVDNVPAEVLRRVAEFRDRLNRLRDQAGMEATLPLEDRGAVVTPSDVFMGSGHMLDGVVEWIIEMTPPHRLVSPFYQQAKFEGMQPRDVFTLVDLAVRRLDLILMDRN